ncbi:MAG: hydroxymethylbilane synthase [Alphaproteobacteria bacterium]|nr:hydroxymethylbilane synthase [Alphaproteobacteria bacterium]
MTEPLRIGTRGSPLALVQAEEVRARLAEIAPDRAIEIVHIRTTGDRVRDRLLAEIGGKGLFTKEIEQALFDRTIDLAVHSMKDVETYLPDGLCIAAVLPREDPRDALICATADTLAGIPAGATIGTASIRRQAQILHRRPDLKVVPFRGNVETRLRKIADGEATATLLAVAGLRRLGLTGAAAGVLEPEELLPAAAQGAIGLETRADDTATRDLAAAIDDPDSALCIGVERAMLAALDGSCLTPIGALAVIDRAGDPPTGLVTLDGLVARPDGTELNRERRQSAAADALAMGTELGAALRARMGSDFFAA